MRTALLILVLLPALLVAPRAAEAQQLDRRLALEAERPAAAPLPFFGRSTIGKVKWATLAASLGLGVYGFVANDNAEDRYDRLEAICVEDPDRCAGRLPNDAFADAQLEAMYQDVVSLDRRARVSLLGSQVGIAASVLLFILDLRESESPPNIPYEPKRLQVSPRADGAVSVGVRLAF